MNRLTKNYDKQYGYELKCDNPNTSINQDISDAIQKLGQLEDIEDELGIDLTTLFKALKNGFYYYNNYGNVVHTSNTESYIFLSAKSCLPNQMCIEVDFGDLETMYFYFQDYGKTWALTKEELL